MEVTLATVEKALGTNRIDTLLYEKLTRPGIAIGLAYTEMGGRCLLIETTKYPGNGQMQLTGQLGNVMKESIGTALSWIKSNAILLGIAPRKRNKHSAAVAVVESADTFSLENDKELSSILSSFDLHVHFPAAAVPKDGPSAGVTITVALVSLMTGRRVRSDFAMTGEISLQGLVLPVGGIKEKCMAAHRNKLTHVILPAKNRKDADDIPEDLRSDLTIHFVERIEEALSLALEDELDH